MQVKTQNTSASSIVTHSLLAAFAISFSTTIHECFHLIVGRILNIPTRFFNLTGVGVPANRIPDFAPFRLALMNGVAPVLSFLIFGCLGYWFLRKSKQDQSSLLRYLMTWMVFLNLPYAGLHLMFTATTVRFNGTGADSAAVTGFLNMPMIARVLIGILGYFVLIGFNALLYLLLPMEKFVPQVELAKVNDPSKPRRYLGYSLILAGLVAVVFGNLQLLTGNSRGTALLLLGGFGFPSAGFAALIPWRSKTSRVLWKQWGLPGFLGSILLVPLGIVNGNDYLTYWLFIGPTIFEVTYFGSIENYTRAPA